jgi:hypothetical protein
MRKLGLTLLAAVLPIVVEAAEILHLDVQRKSNSYRVDLEARLAASPATVWAALTDYPRWSELSPTIRESAMLRSNADGSARVYTLLQTCVLIFCGKKEHVQDLRAPARLELRADTIPTESDFRSGWAHWRLSADGNFTLARFEMEVEPAFWMPPVIGPWAIKRSLYRDAEEAIDRLEQSAQRR